MSTDSIVDAIKERVNHPFFGLFTFFVVVVNIEAIIIILIGDDCLYQRINYIKTDLINIYTVIIYPLFLTVLYIIASQWIMYVIDVVYDKPTELRHILQVKQEQRESQVRQELMKIQESEIAAHAELNETKREMFKNDIKTYEKTQNTLFLYELTQIKVNIEEGYVQREVYEKIKSYINYSEIGEFYFKDSNANDLHEKYVTGLKQLLLCIDKNCYTDSTSKHYSILTNVNSKDELLNCIDVAYHRYNGFNTYMKKEVL